MTANNSGRQAALAGVTEIALVRRPGNLAVVTCAAKTSLDNIRHLEIIAADAHLEPKLGVTHLASEADAMKPVRKNHRTHTFLFGPTIQHDISIFGSGLRCYREQARDQQHKTPKFQGTAHLGGTAPAGIAIGSEGRGFPSPGRATL
ncbi:MAG: hypothetical protein NDI91_06515 [Sulfuritalea sp.]|nr:hypothetical protein [Sulfuritalea sp.]